MTETAKNDLRMIAVAIAVAGSVKKKFLPGAINGAHNFEKWARHQGYETCLVTDETSDVTISLLRQKIETLLKASDKQINRIIIYFAGHGLIRELEEGLWLLSDWRSELRAVAVEVLKRRLTMFKPRQLCIISDACRSLPADVSQMDLVPDSVLGSGPNPVDPSVAIDKFFATQDGAETFMIPGAEPEQDRCLFSGVLLEGLWGRPGIVMKPFSKLEPERITSRSLGAYLQSEVKERAKNYGLSVTATISPTFPEGEDYYVTSSPNGEVPTFPPWPTKEELGLAARSQAAFATGAKATSDKFGASETEEPRHAHWTVGSNDEPKEFNVIHGRSKSLIEDKPTTARRWAARRNDKRIPPRPPRQMPPGKALEQLRQSVLPNPTPGGSGIVIAKATSSRLWLQTGLASSRNGEAGWWSIHGVPHFAPALIEFPRGLFSAVTVLPEFHLLAVRNAAGVTGLSYREADQDRNFVSPIETALSALESGALRSEQATDLAVQLRMLKHVDPVLGVISAYLYDAIGDIESIRRMASFYCSAYQAIPYDIALLAGLKGARTNDGFVVEVPAVSERAPRTEAEREKDWTWRATPATSGAVGGLWPWMRQGWTFLDDPSDVGSPLVIPGLVELRSGLMRSRFTTLKKDAAHALAGLFDLRRVAD